MKKHIYRWAISMFTAVAFLALMVLMYTALYFIVHDKFPSWSIPAGNSTEKNYTKVSDLAGTKNYDKLEGSK